jgi:hypothetical protein
MSQSSAQKKLNFPTMVFSTNPSYGIIEYDVQLYAFQAIVYLEALTGLRLYSVPVFLVDSYEFKKKCHKRPITLITEAELQVVLPVFYALKRAIEKTEIMGPMGMSMETYFREDRLDLEGFVKFISPQLLARREADDNQIFRLFEAFRQLLRDTKESLSACDSFEKELFSALLEIYDSADFLFCTENTELVLNTLLGALKKLARYANSPRVKNNKIRDYIRVSHLYGAYFPDIQSDAKLLQKLRDGGLMPAFCNMHTPAIVLCIEEIKKWVEQTEPEPTDDRVTIISQCFRPIEEVSVENLLRECRGFNGTFGELLQSVIVHEFTHAIIDVGRNHKNMGPSDQDIHDMIDEPLAEWTEIDFMRNSDVHHLILQHAQAHVYSDTWPYAGAMIIERSSTDPDARRDLFRNLLLARRNDGKNAEVWFKKIP